jgi:hypothetical protein
MRKLFITMIVTTLLLGLSAAARAQATADLVQPSLLANVTTIKPGEPFTVGVLLKIKPTWHVYWSNPGDAGLPTRVQWILPPGYAASELRFPVPQRLDQPGGIIVYGYTDEVLLASTITPPAQLAATDAAAIPITAKVNWLCCSLEDCVPGKTTLNLQLMAGEKSQSENAQLFQQWQNRLPLLAPAPAPPLVLSDPSPHTQILTTRRITDPKTIIPGSVDGLILTVGSPQATPTGTTIPLSARVLKGQTVTASSVPILLTWADPDGKARVGEQVNVPLVNGR